MKRKYFYTPYLPDLSLLLLRLFAGLSMAFSHGLPKLNKLMGGGEIRFYDFMGLGEGISLGLAVFAEFLAALLLAAGLFTRLASIPLIITMATAAFAVHGADPFARKEMSLFYLVVFLVIFLQGPGKYSVDARLGK